METRERAGKRHATRVDPSLTNAPPSRPGAVSRRKSKAQPEAGRKRPVAVLQSLRASGSDSASIWPNSVVATVSASDWEKATMGEKAMVGETGPGSLFDSKWRLLPCNRAEGKGEAMRVGARPVS